MIFKKFLGKLYEFNLPSTTVQLYNNVWEMILVNNLKGLVFLYFNYQRPIMIKRLN